MNYISSAQAADRLGLTVRRIQQMCRSGEIDGAVRRGRTWCIPEDALNDRLSIVSGNTFSLREPGISYRSRKAGDVPPAADVRLPLPVGISSYREAVTNYYYVDKTLMIRDFIDTLPKVSLFTRPRRFGKTLNMDMLRVFFERSDEDTSVYFRGRAIWSCGERYRQFQGKHPVIFLTLKDAKFSTWAETFRDLTDTIRQEFARHSEVARSSRCNDFEKDFYHRVMEGTADEAALSRSLSVLSSMLTHHYGEPAVIIIDEYDTPIQMGHLHGYYDQVTEFTRNLFSGTFKDNHCLAYGFLTGILSIARESIFSGMNNLKVHSVLDRRFSSYFGFTADEVRQMLDYYGYGDHLEEACRWYDGYHFGDSEIFNPWSVINYIDEGCVPLAYWQSTGSNEIIGEIIAHATPEITENLRRLMQGESIAAYVDTSVIYPDIPRRPSTIYSFLLVAGYLKALDIHVQGDGNYMCRLLIPNREISFVYEKEILSRLQPPAAESIALAIQQAVISRDTRKLQEKIQEYLAETISYYDTGSEAFYQGLMIGLCAVLNNRYIVTSNRESGLGRFDIQLKPLEKGLPGFIFELKSTRDQEADLRSLAGSALQQIRRKDYDTDLKQAGVSAIIRVGIAFCGKNVEQIAED